MPNPDFNEDFNKRKSSPGGMKEKPSGSHGKVNEKTASWGKLPGKTGPNRSAGVKKLKIYPKSDGI